MEHKEVLVTAEKEDIPMVTILHQVRGFSMSVLVEQERILIARVRVIYICPLMEDIMVEELAR
jgi:hypothetical protein